MLRSNADIRRGSYFELGLPVLPRVRLHGVGGQTVQTLQANHLHVVRGLAPDIVILEIGTNDLSKLAPEKVGSAIEDLVRRFQSDFSVRAIGVCYVIPRGIFFPYAMSFWRNSTVLNQYVSVLLADLLNVFCWSHPEFNNLHKRFLFSGRGSLESIPTVFTLPQLSRCRPQSCRSSSEELANDFYKGF